MSDIKNYKERWNKIKELGVGGQGTTIECSDLRNPSISAAVKILSRQGDLERRARMHRETTNLLTLSYFNIPKVIDSNSEFWQDFNYKLYLSTEFISGKNLAELNYENKSYEDKLDMTISLCETINYCHSRGVIHRDIKPDNIMLRNSAGTEVVVIDFGISFNFTEQDDDNLTPDGQHLGNRFLILPEQKVGEVSKRDVRTDVTCIVGILYYLLFNINPTIINDEHNRKPHQRKIAKSIISGFPIHQRDELNFIFDIGFNQLIDKRWQTAQSLLLQLKSLKELMPSINPKEIDPLAYIKSKLQDHNFEEENRKGEILRGIEMSCSNALRQIHEELGSTTWSPYTLGGGGLAMDTGGEIYSKIIWGINEINTPRLRVEKIIHGYFTGNELVIALIDNTPLINKSPLEVFRQPYSNELNFTEFENTIKNMYLTTLANII